MCLPVKKQGQIEALWTQGQLREKVIAVLSINLLSLCTLKVLFLEKSPGQKNFLKSPVWFGNRILWSFHLRCHTSQPPLVPYWNSEAHKNKCISILRFTICDNVSSRLRKQDSRLRRSEVATRCNSLLPMKCQESFFFFLQERDCNKAYSCYLFLFPHIEGFIWHPIKNWHFMCSAPQRQVQGTSVLHFITNQIMLVLYAVLASPPFLTEHYSYSDYWLHCLQYVQGVEKVKWQLL